MSVLSIRKLPKNLEKALIREAKRRHKTKTEIVIESLQKTLHLDPVTRRRESLRAFFGKMSPADLKSFQEATQSFSKIDEELWA